MYKFTSKYIAFMQLKCMIYSKKKQLAKWVLLLVEKIMLYAYQSDHNAVCISKWPSSERTDKMTVNVDRLQNLTLNCVWHNEE